MPAPLKFDIVSAAQQVLGSTPSATGDRPTFAVTTLICLGAFMILDGLLFVILWEVLPNGMPKGKRVQIRQAFVSMIHSAASVPLVIWLYRNITNADMGPPGVLGYGPLTYIPMSKIDFAGAIFLSYLLWDLFHACSNYTVYAKSMVETLIHHAGFFASMAINMDTLWCASATSLIPPAHDLLPPALPSSAVPVPSVPVSNPLTTSVRARSHCRCNYAFPILYLGEISTFFLSLRITYRMLDVPELYASSLFASTFFLTRIVTFGLLVVQLFSHAGDLTLLLSTPLLVSYLILLPALYCLNCYWFYKIFQSVLRVFQGGSASASGHYETDPTKME